MHCTGLLHLAFTMHRFSNSCNQQLIFLFLDQNLCCGAPKTNVKTDEKENIHNFTLKYFCISVPMKFQDFS